MNLPELTQVALLGTERQGISIPAAATSLGRLQSQIDVNQRERALLSLAALSGLHERIGSLPARDQAPLPQPCPVEQRKRANERTGSLLLRLLAGEFAELLPEWLALAARADLLAPPEALPGLLNLGASKSEFRETVLPVLGERGRWLATQNPEWAWVSGAAGESEDVWHVGERPARLLFLQRLRRTNPARARELLAGTWQAETPEDRAAFLAAFEAGLTLDDELLLESALDDKRKEVRKAAAALLARLPGSALVKRMLERVKPLLKFVPAEAGSLVKLKKGKPAVIEVTLPAECDKAMQRDGIEPKPPPSMGEKASWLIQMLEVVPLSVWTVEWGIQHAGIMAASNASDWKGEFLLAWLRAAIRQKDSGWAEELFGVTFESRQFNQMGNLLSVMPPASREARLSEMLASSDSKVREFQGYLVANAKSQWSASFSGTVLLWLKRLAAEKSSDWQLRSQLKDFAACLDPSALTEALNGWPAESEGWAFWSKGVEEFLAVTQFRADLRAAFEAEP